MLAALLRRVVRAAVRAAELAAVLETVLEMALTSAESAALAVARHPLGRLAAMAGLSAIPGGLALLARLTRVADPHALAPA